MRVSLRVEGEEDLRSLQDWLLADRTVRRGAQIELASSSHEEPGRQGPAYDILSLLLGTSFNAASLGVAVASWRSSRPQPPAVLIERADGSKVTISGASPEDEQRLLRELLGDQP
jgi:hypothetical protein